MDFGTSLAEYGLAGIIIFVLGVVVVTLYKENKVLTQKLLDMTETRRLETVETQKQLTGVMQTFSQSAQMLVDKIIPVQRGKQ